MTCLPELFRRARTKLRIGIIVAATTSPVAVALAATQYHYDDLGRLMLVANDDGSTIVYTHDESGNVLSITSGELAIASFSPTSGYIGDSITILGTGFHPEAVEPT